MIKGVNKRILEIRLDDSRYFERAVLFLRADAPDVSAYMLEEEARKALPEITAGRCFSLLRFLVRQIPRAAAVICAVCSVMMLKGYFS